MKITSIATAYILATVKLKTGEQQQILKSLDGPYNVNNEYVYYTQDNDIYRIKAIPGAKPQILTSEKLSGGPDGKNKFKALYLLPSGLYTEDIRYNLYKLDSDGVLFDIRYWEDEWKNS